MSNLNIKTAIDFSRQIISTVANPYDLCSVLDIDVVLDRKTHKDGYLICESGCKIIIVSSDISNPHRRKFIISHELGHFLMHRERLFCCDSISETCFSNKINSIDQEYEANEFASEYLMPRLDLLKLLPNRVLCFADISRIARHFDVSMTFSAIKSVRSSNTESEILLCYHGDILKWFVCADDSLRYSQLPSRCPVDLMTNGPAKVVGIWDSLYEGTVNQEIIHPISNQNLILLSGKRHDIEEY